MSRYLTKEEIKQWRSSLEKITLEEYAKRLGKVLEEDKKTSDLIDIVMKNEKRMYTSSSKTNAKEKVLKACKDAQTVQDKIMAEDKSTFSSVKEKLTCKKPLTEREDKVLEYFVNNKDQIVYAKDLAVLLNLPTDYVYKYIKNLRTKISEDILVNATKGGYIFKI